MEIDPSTSDVSATIEPLLGPPLESGDLGSVGDYRLLEKIGHGGMGIVFRGRKVGETSDLAVKILAPALMGSAKARQRFLREAALAADLRHERLTGLIDLGEANGLPFIAMPLLLGETLEQRLQRDSSPGQGFILTVAREAAEGLAFAHSKGIVHRDIKPSNIFLQRNDGSDAAASDGSFFQVKLLDLGLARRVDDDEHVTSTGIVLGTPEYMAPEQVRGENGGPRADLFSLGCVLYRIATGTPPFRGTNMMAVLRSLALTQPKPPREINPAISQGLSDFILTLIAKDPAERPTSAEETCRVLDRIHDFRSSLHSQVGLALPKKKTVERRSRLLVLSIVVVCLVAIVGAVTALVPGYWNDLVPSRGPGDGDAKIVKQTGSPANEKLPEKAPETPTTPKEPALPQGLLYAKKGLLTSADPISKTRIGSYSQVHRLVLHGKKVYCIDLNSSEFDAFLMLEHSDGSLIATDDDGGKNADSQTDAQIVMRIPADDEYRIVVTTFKANQVGKFQLSVKEASVVEYLKVRTLAFATLTPAGAAQHIADVQALLDEQKTEITREAADIAESLVHRFRPMTPHIAADHCQLLAKKLSVSTDPYIQNKVRWIEGAERRYRLPGTTLELSGTTLEGAPFDWSAYRGKFVLVDVWAEWCPYCKAEAPQLKRYHQAFKDKGFEIVGINLDPLPQLAIDFTRNQEIPWVSISGKVKRGGPSLEAYFGISSIPERILVDPAGKVISIVARGQELPRILKDRLGQASESIFDLASPTAPLSSVVFSPDSQRVVAGGYDSTLLSWAASTTGPPSTLRGHNGAINAVAVRPDGQWIASAGSDGTVKLWLTASGRSVLTLKGLLKMVTAVAFSPDGEKIVGGNFGGGIKTWDIGTGDELRSLNGHKAGITCVEFSPDGSRIVSGDNDGVVKIWDAGSGATLLTMAGPKAALRFTSFSADGSEVATCSFNGIVRYWNVKSGETIRWFDTNNPATASAAISRDGTRIATGSNDGDVTIWDATTGRELARFVAHDAPVTGLAFTRDGARLASASIDRMIRIWQVPAKDSVTNPNP